MKSKVRATVQRNRYQDYMTTQTYKEKNPFYLYDAFTLSGWISKLYWTWTNTDGKLIALR